MKFKYIIFVLSIFFFASCGNDYVLDDNFDLQELPGYVAFDAPGNDITLEAIETTEDGGDVTLTIECPTGTLSDITVTYDLGGNAVLGTDYNVATPGTVIIKRDTDDFEERDMADIVFEILTDDVFDGTKVIEVTLTGASNDNGTLAVGRGGTDFLKSTTITIGDIDCNILDIAGTYTAEATGLSTDACCPDEEMTTSTVEIVDNGDGTFTINDWSAGLYIAWYDVYGIDQSTVDSGGLSSVLTIGSDTDGNGTCDFSGSGTEPFGESFNVTVAPNEDGTLLLGFTNGYDDVGGASLTP